MDQITSLYPNLVRHRPGVYAIARTILIPFLAPIRHEELLEYDAKPSEPWPAGNGGSGRCRREVTKIPVWPFDVVAHRPALIQITLCSLYVLYRMDRLTFLDCNDVTKQEKEMAKRRGQFMITRQPKPAAQVSR